MEAFSQVILDSERLKNLDPWEVDVEQELTRLLQLLGERINLFICGVAAENSAFVHWKKVDEIMILRERMERARARVPEDSVEEIGELPSLQILWTGGTRLIDLSGILTSLVDFIDAIEKRKMEAAIAPEPPPILQEDFIRRLHILSMEVYAVIQRLFEHYGEEISFNNLIKKAPGLTAVEIFILILFLYMENLINLNPLEKEEEVVDIIILPAEG